MLNNKALAASLSGGPKTYVEDVFSTYLYTGNGSTQTITNGIDLSGKGGLVWVKARTASAAPDHVFADTTRGASNYLSSNSASAQINDSSNIDSFTSSGFSVNLGGRVNQNANNYVSWTFRKAAKFFDVVTWTGDGTNNRSINHSLSSNPGVIIVKRTDSTSNWAVYSPASLWTGESYTGLYLNTTGTIGSTTVNGQGISAVSTTSFTVISSGSNPLEFNPNVNGATYVAYLFASNAGGFGNSGNDNVISCGSYTGNGSTNGPIVTLGWEPQWLLIKKTSAADDWILIDNIRGFTVEGDTKYLNPNNSFAESSFGLARPLSTGFQLRTSDSTVNTNNGTYIYIAIRRGPMKTPTDATKVFYPDKYAEVGNPPGIGPRVFGFPPDLVFNTRLSGGYTYYVADKLRGGDKNLITFSTNAEVANTTYTFNNNGVTPGFYFNNSPGEYSNFLGFQRAPGFFDIVAWTATGSTSINHNLGAIPELIIAKTRSIAGDNWTVYTQAGGRSNVLFLNTTNSNVGVTNYWGTSDPTATTFGVATFGSSNNVGNMVAYLFASCPGVSKVGSYTGTGNTQQINCNFTNGSRFVLIKRTDTSGDWYQWDSARGIIPGNDPYLLLNSSAGEVTNTDYIDTYSAGFEISSTAPAAINANGGSYIYLAIA